MQSNKCRVAVFFGGTSPEHDVSIVTALQVMSAIDRDNYEIIPVYVSTEGSWWTGDILCFRETYLPSQAEFRKLTQVTLDFSSRMRPRLMPVSRSLGWRQDGIPFDVAVPAFHGTFGEDGNFQGALETAAVPYTGMRTLASAVLMDKIATKRLLTTADIPILPFRQVRRPTEGLLLTVAELAEVVGDFPFPCCIKPCHLGSSIGVARVESLEELADVLPTIFRMDQEALLEPFVEDMVEYNLAVSKVCGEVRTSAIEKPKRSSELLDFKEKYLSGGGQKAEGQKIPGQSSSEGMLSLTRELNPQLSSATVDNLRRWGRDAFVLVGGTGAPRIDFISNGRTGEVWLNEINPCPGSFGFFLWEAASEPILFAELMDLLIKEALHQHTATRLPRDPTPVDARLFQRRQ